MGTVNVTVEGTVQPVAVTDIPVSILVTLAGQANIPIPIAGPFNAEFQNVPDGTYAGTVQAVRADGTGIGEAIGYSVTVSSAFVPASVTVTVTP